MNRKILIACVILLSVVLLCGLLFITKQEGNLAEPPETDPGAETGNRETVGSEVPKASTGNTDPDKAPEATTITPEETVQTQPQETTPPATTKPAETIKPTDGESQKPTQGTSGSDEKLDPDELPLVPNK